MDVVTSQIAGTSVMPEWRLGERRMPASSGSPSSMNRRRHSAGEVLMNSFATGDGLRPLGIITWVTRDARYVFARIVVG